MYKDEWSWLVPSRELRYCKHRSNESCATASTAASRTMSQHALPSLRS